MFSVVVLVLFCAGFAAGYGLRAHISRRRRTRRIVLPQAMRLILPPLITQYILILKNSSLGAAIAYPDLMLVTGTVLNQTGQPIDIMAITMAIRPIVFDHNACEGESPANR